jgi:hypothetical protein
VTEQPPSRPPDPVSIMVAANLRALRCLIPEHRRQLFDALRTEFCLTCGGEGHRCRCWDDDLR